MNKKNKNNHHHYPWKLFPFAVHAVCFLLSIGTLKAQQLNHTLNRDYLYGFENYFNNKEENFQTFVKPYRIINTLAIEDSTIAFPVLDKKYKKFLQLSTADKNDKKLKITAQPLFVSQAGFQASSTNRFTHDLGIGATVSGDLGEKFSFNLKAMAGKAVFNSFVDSIINEINVVPGIGYAYHDNLDSINKSYSYQYYSGYVSYSPNKIFNFQLGRDKHSWGDGYRSNYLSDVAAPYPYFKITTNIWRINYVNLFTVMKDPMTNPTGLKKDWLDKYATFHYLGVNVTKRINVGFFESIIWQGSDSTRHRGYDVNYLNPIIFYRPVEYSTGSSDNSSLGVNLKIKCFKKQQVYGQILLDDFSVQEALKFNGFWQNKYAYQLGIKSFDLFTIKGLNLLTEFNYVTPYTYSHGTIQQSVGHMNQPLSHPLGANFMESVSILNYRKNRFFVEGKFVYAIYGADSIGTDHGKNIFIPYGNRTSDYGNYVGQGVKTELITSSLRIAYILDSKMNLRIEAGGIYRMEKTIVETKHIPYFFIGIKTDLGNVYSDF